jgi:hypothetical protein
MTIYEQHMMYVRAWAATALRAEPGRDRGDVSQAVVLTGLSLLGAAAVGLILWGKLRDGASDIDVPAPQAP